MFENNIHIHIYWPLGNASLLHTIKTVENKKIFLIIKKNLLYITKYIFVKLFFAFITVSLG